MTRHPAWTLRLALRVCAVVLHMLLAFVLAFAIGLFFVRDRAWQEPVIAWWLRRLNRVLNLDIRVDGAPVDEGALWISNHVSWMDIPVIGSVRVVKFLSKAEVAEWPLIGHLARAAGTLFIRRGSGDSARVSGEITNALRAGRRVLFFPEGTTTDGFTLKRFFGKLFAAAVETNCLIQPVLLCYQREDGQLHALAPFIGDDEMGAHLLHMLNGERIQVVLHFLPAERADGRDASALASHFEQLMRQRLSALHGAEQAPSRAGHPGVQAA